MYHLHEHLRCSQDPLLHSGWGPSCASQSMWQQLHYLWFDKQENNNNSVLCMSAAGLLQGGADSVQSGPQPVNHHSANQHHHHLFVQVKTLTDHSSQKHCFSLIHGDQNYKSSQGTVYYKDKQHWQNISDHIVREKKIPVTGTSHPKSTCLETTALSPLVWWMGKWRKEKHKGSCGVTDNQEVQILSCVEFRLMQ